jgi:chromatin remodeling complex protein RSC6
MVDITKIVEKGMKDQKGSKNPAKMSEKPKKVEEKEKTALDNLFGEKNPDQDAKSSNSVQFSPKLGNLFGVEEENDG